MYPINEVVRLKKNLEAAGEKKRGRHPVFNANMFYPRAIENDLQDLLKAELERIFLLNMQAALVGLRDDIADLNAAPVTLSPEFVEKTGLIATRVNEHAGQAYQKQVDMIIGRPYYPPGAQREILEAWHSEFQTLCISAGQEGKKKIAMTVAVAKEKGWNKLQTEAAIREILPAETKHRAELIARTELGKLNTRCVLSNYEQTGIKYYKWLTTIDGRERESHALMNGLICSVTDPDVYYDDNPENPLRPIEHKRTGDMVHLHPGQDFQCRCTMVMWEPEIDSAYEVKEDQERAEQERLEQEEKARQEEEEKRRKEQEAEQERKRKEAEEKARAEMEKKAEERAKRKYAREKKKAEEAARKAQEQAEKATQKQENAERLLRLMKAANSRHLKRTEEQGNALKSHYTERKARNENFNKAIEAAKLARVGFRNPDKLTAVLTSEQIISKISGGDMTRGSCSSLAFTYAANRAGLDVVDFRGAESCDFFSRFFNIKTIVETGGFIETAPSGFKVAEKLLSHVEEGKEYYFTSGAHATIIRKEKGVFQYLELQSGYKERNGFKPLTKEVLKFRYHTKQSRSILGRKMDFSEVLIDIEKLKDSPKFRELMGFINTEPGKQKAGQLGSMK